MADTQTYRMFNLEKLNKTTLYSATSYYRSLVMIGVMQGWG